jgi:NAD(P)H-dependent FMN reductase
MSSILVVTGSVRPNSVNEIITPLVVAEAEKQGATVTVANLKELALPFFDAPVPPASPDFTPEHEGVIEWTKLVAEADGVILVTPEYNHTMTPVQLNAIDWIANEWKAKKVGLVGYGWNGAHQSHATAREVLAVNLKAIVGDDQTNLHFTQEISPDGSILDAEKITESIAATVAEVIA